MRNFSRLGWAVVLFGRACVPDRSRRISAYTGTDEIPIRERRMQYSVRLKTGGLCALSWRAGGPVRRLVRRAISVTPEN